jgi:hypothetical protein
MPPLQSIMMMARIIIAVTKALLPLFFLAAAFVVSAFFSKVASLQV